MSVPNCERRSGPIVVQFIQVIQSLYCLSDLAKHFSSTLKRQQVPVHCKLHVKKYALLASHIQVLKTVIRYIVQQAKLCMSVVLLTDDLLLRIA